MQVRVRNGSTFLLMAPWGLGLCWCSGFCDFVPPQGELKEQEPWHLNCKIENPRRRRGMTHVARAEYAGRLLSIFPPRKQLLLQKTETKSREANKGTKQNSKNGQCTANAPCLLPRKLERNRKLKLAVAQPSPDLQHFVRLSTKGVHHFMLSTKNVFVEWTNFKPQLL